MTIREQMKKQVEEMRLQGKEVKEARGLQVASVEEAIEIGEKTGKKFIEILRDLPNFDFKKGDIVEVYATNANALLVYSNNETDIEVGYTPRLCLETNYRRINFK